MATILITGMAGGLAQRVARCLLEEGHEVVGVDYRPVPPLSGPLSAIRIYRANYNKTIIEDLFRHHVPAEVLHLGRVGNLKESLGKRFDLNVVGTQKIMNLCLQHHVRTLVVLSTFHIYGAHPANHIPISEEEPLRAGTEFPQIADAIQLDNMATSWVWRHPEVRIVVLRPTNVVGPNIYNTMSQFLRLRRVPHLLGFNPMMQFIHEEDMASAILAARAVAGRGIFNVAGMGSVPWRTALALAGAKTFPLPSTLVRAYLRVTAAFPEYLINFFKYPCIISDRAFREAFRWQPRVSLTDTLWSTVAEARARQNPSAAGSVSCG
ncbi:MAG: NAD-dependent epimerase/dehydratase family protein [Myxococcales bacterium]|nr:NAD-dependent epimerase/dehydratase family protein [Myxococcota bacterium]MDW8280785.1 NAD-dependent epimerase/dehydratase family protein [Myxococcales bacterium]